MTFLKRDNAEVFFNVSGEQGSWITLVNGHTRSHKDFRSLIKHLNIAGYRCLSLDNRGSGTTTTQSPFSFTDMIEDVEALWDHLNIKSTHLLGISMGGMISRELTLRNPTLIKSLQLISTGMSQKDLSPKALEPWKPSPSQIKEKLECYFTEDFVNRNRILVNSMVKQIMKSISEGTFIENSEAQRQAMSEAKMSANFNNLDTPCQIIHGELDQIIPSSAAVELDSRITNSKLHILESAGHLLLAERPRELYKLVLESMTEND